MQYIMEQFGFLTLGTLEVVFRGGADIIVKDDGRIDPHTKILLESGELTSVAGFDNIRERVLLRVV